MEIISTDQLVGSWLRTCHGAWNDLMQDARASAELFSGERGMADQLTQIPPAAILRRQVIESTCRAGYAESCSLPNTVHEVITNNLILALQQ